VLFRRKPEVIVRQGGRIVPFRPGDRNGMVLLADGRIQKIGATIDDPRRREGASTLPKGAWVLPGFIDAHSHSGARSTSEESTESLTPEARRSRRSRAGIPTCAPRSARA
jgi:imidazolonepropionase-like amidohydrolase